MTNRVDTLRAEIDTIQETCVHTFKLDRENPFTESNVVGVFLGNLAGPFKAESKASVKHGGYFSYVCTECSISKDAHVAFLCPKCFIKLIPRDGLENRPKYLGEEYIYYRVRLSDCRQCHLRVVSDEWDQ